MYVAIDRLTKQGALEKCYDPSKAPLSDKNEMLQGIFKVIGLITSCEKRVDT